jgi:chromate reductase, NAD(P)H dehydrogenase (quinone)
MESPLHVLGLSGSLREQSYNRGLLRAAQEVAPPGMEIEVFDLHGIPVYDGDVERLGDPGPVKALKLAIDRADAVLIATPEYNYGIPGGLKNAIDWASRPPRYSVLDGKPVAVMGASTGIGGTANAQAQLRQTLMYPGAQTMPEPEVLVSKARDRFDAEGNLVDEETRESVHKLLDALVEWSARVRSVAAAA